MNGLRKYGAQVCNESTRRRREKGAEKIFEEITAENLIKWKLLTYTTEKLKKLNENY